MPSAADPAPLLRRCPAFAQLPEADLAALAAKFEPVNLRLGHTVYSAGDPADGFYLVASGRVRVVVENREGQRVTLSVLGAGQHFGEEAIQDNGQYGATVRAASDVTLFRLPGREFSRWTAEHVQAREYFAHFLTHASLQQFLKRFSTLGALSAEELGQIVDSLTIEEFPAGAAVVREGDPADALYIVQSGVGQVIQGTQTPRLVNQVAAGDLFGEMGLIHNTTRAASIIAATPMAVYRLGREDFNRLLERIPQMRETLTALAAGYRCAEDSPQVAAAPVPVAQPMAPDERAAAGEQWARRRRGRWYCVPQLSESDCGAAALATVARYYGKRLSVSHLAELCNISQEGASLQSLAEAAESIGLRSRGVRITYERLIQADLPAVAHWLGYHYIVVFRATTKGVVLADPALGIVKLSREEFERGWTGIALLLTPTPRLMEATEAAPSYRRYVDVLRPYVPLIGEVLLAALVLEILGLASPIFTQNIIDNVLVHHNQSLLQVLLLGMVIVAAMQLIVTAVRDFLVAHLVRRVDAEMLVQFFAHLLSLPLAYFQSRRVGDFVARLEENSKLRALFTGSAPKAFLNLLMVVVYLSLMIYYNAKLTAVAMAFMPLYAGLTLLMTPIMKRQSREAFYRHADSQAYMIESVSGIQVVKTQSAERAVRWKWEGLLARAMNIQFRGATIGIAAGAASRTLQTLNTTVLLYYGATLVMSGELTLGQMMAFYTLLGSVTAPIMEFIGLWQEVQEATVSVERLNDVFNAAPEQGEDPQDLMRLPPVRGHISFENVTFRYFSHSETNALQNISLEVQPGMTLAVVGRSGAGKSTFANLLLGLYAPTVGRVSIDGYDLRRVALSSLRPQVGVVPQDVFLFSGSIRDNISLGHLNATLENVIGAATLAGAHDFISELPLGYHTVIGERGMGLSGGQRQRLAIARALISRPRILVFDEATSSLDTESERAIQERLNRLLQDRTTIIIAHRLSTVRNADRIIVLDRGLIVESGSHDELSAQGGLYAHLLGEQLNM
jgi:subfamily B ATP-binding cassette protein HlyB/CyaB